MSVGWNFALPMLVTPSEGFSPSRGVRPLKPCGLVYYEKFGDVRKAIAREKQIKRWRREKKIWLIERVNRNWKDLSGGWYDDKGAAPRLGLKPSLGVTDRDEQANKPA